MVNAGAQPGAFHLAASVGVAEGGIAVPMLHLPAGYVATPTS